MSIVRWKFVFYDHKGQFEVRLLKDWPEVVIGKRTNKIQDIRIPGFNRQGELGITHYRRNTKWNKVVITDCFEHTSREYALS